MVDMAMEATAREDTDMDTITTEVDPITETGEDMISTITTMEDTGVTVGHVIYIHIKLILRKHWGGIWFLT